MATIKSHRDFIAWQKAVDLAQDVYRLTSAFPREEMYRLTSQLIRAVISVPANIAEGHARGTGRDCANFLAIAKGSLMEAETFLMLAERLGYDKPKTIDRTLSLATEVSKINRVTFGAPGNGRLGSRHGGVTSRPVPCTLSPVT